MLLLVLTKSSHKEQSEGSVITQQVNFLKSYFGDFEGYKFIRAFYDNIKNGYIDWTALKDEINPVSEQKDPFTEELWKATQTREWWYLSDIDYANWIDTISKHILSMQPINTAKLVYAIIYLKHASERACIKIDPKVDQRIRERISDNADSGDESFERKDRIYLSEQSRVWEPYLAGYDDNAKVASILSLIPDVLRIMGEGDIRSFIDCINKPRGLLAAITEKSLSALRDIYFSNPMFFDDALFLIKDSLLSHRGGNIIPDAEGKLVQIRNYVVDFLKDPAIDNSGRRRLKDLLNQLPLVGEDRKESQEPEDTSAVQ
jgi:hypothetical protein